MFHWYTVHTCKMSEKFALKWNDYQSNLNKTLSQLRTDTDLADVTLISDDKVKFLAHKVLLSSCSNMFKFILKENNNTNPFLYLGGINSVNLDAILDYIYHGVVNIYQEQLDSFLECAHKLEIGGLIGQESLPEETNYERLEDKVFPEDEDEKHNERREDDVFPRDKEMHSEGTENRKGRQYAGSTESDVSKIDVATLTSEEIQEKIKELIMKTDDMWTCIACGYISTSRSNVRKHVDKHIDGLSYSCNLCNKEFRLVNSLNCHKKKYIRQNCQGKTFFNSFIIIFRNLKSLYSHQYRIHRFKF